MVEFGDLRTASWTPGVSERPRCLASLHDVSTVTVFQTKQNLEWKNIHIYG